jgi:hypothetical protein
LPGGNLQGPELTKLKAKGLRHGKPTVAASCSKESKNDNHTQKEFFVQKNEFRLVLQGFEVLKIIGFWI